MRKSLQKTLPSGLSSRLERPSAGLLAGGGRPPGAEGNGATGQGRRLPAPVGDAEHLAARLRLLEGFLSRTDIADCAQLALQWLGSELSRRAVDLPGSAPARADRWSPWRRAACRARPPRRSRCRSTIGPTRSVELFNDRRSALLPRRAFEPPIAAGGRRRHSRTAAFRVIPLSVSGLDGLIRHAAARGRLADPRTSSTGSPRSSARSSIRSCGSRR